MPRFMDVGPHTNIGALHEGAFNDCLELPTGYADKAFRATLNPCSRLAALQLPFVMRQDPCILLLHTLESGSHPAIARRWDPDGCT